MQPSRRRAVYFRQAIAGSFHGLAITRRSGRSYTSSADSRGRSCIAAFGTLNTVPDPIQTLRKRACANLFENYDHWATMYRSLKCRQLQRSEWAIRVGFSTVPQVLCAAAKRRRMYNSAASLGARSPHHGSQLAPRCARIVGANRGLGKLGDGRGRLIAAKIND